MAEAISFFIETNSPEYKCTIATDAYEALNSLCENKFDLVLSDQEMRPMQTIGDILSLLRARGKIKP